jgi:N-acetylmuramoyl-L-alanine amidase
MLLSFCVHQNVLATSGAADRGVRRARFYVLQYVDCPAVLVECGFLSNSFESSQVATSAYRERIATGIAQGILAYKKSVERGA